MEYGIALRDFNLIIKFENCEIKIIDGNWGVFKKSFINHMHSYYELHFVSGGQGTLITEDLEMPLHKGCFYLLPPRTYHEQLSQQTDFLEEYHLSFELTHYLKGDLIWESLFSNGYYDMKQSDLEVFFKNIAEELSQKQYGYQEIISQNIQSIFITLMRSLACNNKFSVPDIHLDDQRIMLIDKAFLYNYMTVTLSSMSDQLKLSTRQTQRFIKEKYGVPFSTLKLQSRLNHAAMLLLTTKLSLDEICFQVGYKNYSFFSRLFRQRYNMTPVKYRKTYRRE